MAIPKIEKQDIAAAMKYIDEHGVPEKNKSTQYVLATEDGKQYPPKYVIGVADHLANGVEILTNGFNAVEAKNYFEARGYRIELKQEKFELTIKTGIYQASSLPGRVQGGCRSRTFERKWGRDRRLSEKCDRHWKTVRQWRP